MPVGLTGGCDQGRRPREQGERCLGPDPRYLAYLPQDLGRDERTDSRDLGERGVDLSEREAEMGADMSDGAGEMDLDLRWHRKTAIRG